MHQSEKEKQTKLLLKVYPLTAEGCEGHSYTNTFVVFFNVNLYLVHFCLQMQYRLKKAGETAFWTAGVSVRQLRC